MDYSEIDLDKYVIKVTQALRKSNLITLGTAYNLCNRYKNTIIERMKENCDPRITAKVICSLLVESL